MITCDPLMVEARLLTKGVKGLIYRFFLRPVKFKTLAEFESCHINRRLLPGEY